jgi:hypothetical protein
MSDIRYHTFLDDVTADTLYRYSYNRWIISLDNVQYRTITKIYKETIIQEITYIYNEERNTFFDEVSSDVFMMLQQIFGKKFVNWTQTWQENIRDCKIYHKFIMEGNYHMFVGTSCWRIITTWMFYGKEILQVCGYC